MTTLSFLLLSLLALSHILTTGDAADVLAARVVLSNLTATPVPQHCSPTIEAKFDQPSSSITSLVVQLQIAGLDSSCGTTTTTGRFSLDIFEYGRKAHDAGSDASQAGTATYEFGQLVASIWHNAANTLGYTVTLNGVSLTRGQEASVLGRALVLQHCTTASPSSCTVLLASGVIGKRTPDNKDDTNVAGKKFFKADYSRYFFILLNNF